MATGHIRGAHPDQGDVAVTISNSPAVGSASQTSLPPRGPSLVGRSGGYDWTRHTRTYSVNLAGPGTTGTVGGPSPPFSAPGAFAQDLGLAFPLL